MHTYVPRVVDRQLGHAGIAVVRLLGSIQVSLRRDQVGSGCGGWALLVRPHDRRKDGVGGRHRLKDEAGGTVGRDCKIKSCVSARLKSTDHRRLLL